MTIDEFDYAMIRIVEVFGERYYTVNRKQILFAQFDKYSKDVFLRACDYLIASSRQPPLIKEFKEAIEVVRKTHSSSVMFTSNCKKCDTFGTILKYNSEILYAFQCTYCEAGFRNYKSLPIWENRLEEYYKNPDYDSATSRIFKFEKLKLLPSIKTIDGAMQ